MSRLRSPIPVGFCWVSLFLVPCIAGQQCMLFPVSPGDPPEESQFVEVPTQGPGSAISVGDTYVLLSAGGSVPNVGGILVSQSDDGFLRRVESVQNNADGSLTVQTSQASLTDLVQDGDFSFTNGPVARKTMAQAKTFEVFSMQTRLDKDWYKGDYFTVSTSGEFVLGMNLDLQISIRNSRLKYFACSVEGMASLDLLGRIDFDATRQLGSGGEGVPLLPQPLRKRLYGTIAGWPVVIVVTGNLYAGVEGHGSAGSDLSAGCFAASLVRFGAAYTDGNWSMIRDQDFVFAPQGPTWCVEGELGAKIFVKPVIELQFYGVVGPRFDLEPYLEFGAVAQACLTAGLSPSGTYDWELAAGLAGHAKMKADILDRYVIESPLLTLFDLRWPLASGSRTASGPTVLSLSVNNGAPEATGRTVTLNNTCSGSPTHYMASESSSFAGALWQTYSQSPSFMLSTGNGTKTVWFKVKDASGESSFVSDTITLLEEQNPQTLTLYLGGDATMDLVRIPAGTFQMGDPNLSPAHSVTITQPFYIGKYEVTQSQWNAVMGTNPSLRIGDSLPVGNVSWSDAQSYCQALSVRAEREIRLPSEAEWEYACRAGSTADYCYGSDIAQLDQYAWYGVNSDGWPHPVGHKLPNAFGLYDMHGNAWEWCQDWFAPYPSEPQLDPTGPNSGSYRVIRGGGWAVIAKNCRSAVRGYIELDRTADSGFRVAAGIQSGAVPTVTLFAINNGAPETTDRTVALNNTCSGSPTHYMASESSSFAGSSWQTYSPSPSFTLSTGNGTKTIWFKVKDASGESSVITDTITLNEGSGGTGWRPLGAGVSEGVNSLTVYGGQLIAGGLFETADGGPSNYIAKWDGKSWSALGTGLNDVVFCQTVYNGQLIVGGRFTTAGGVQAAHLARWDGAVWRPLGTALDGPVWALTVYNGELIAGGQFRKSGELSVGCIARWDGTSWHPLDSGLDGATSHGPYVAALIVHNGELIVGGAFTAAGGVPASYIARWNGAVWQPLGSGTAGAETGVPAVECLGVYNGELIATGNFTIAGGVPCNYIARWNGFAWHPLGTGMEYNAYAAALTVYNGELIAGGNFTAAGGVPASYIARWNGAVWQPLDGGMGGPTYYMRDVRALAVYNGRLVAAGVFSTAGGVHCNNIAEWTSGD